MLAEKGSPLTVKEIYECIDQGNQAYGNAVDQRVVDEINANPEGVTFEILIQLSLGVEEKYLEYYRAAIIEMLAEKGSPLTIEEVYQCINDGNQAYKEELIQKAVDEINNNPTGFSIDTLRKLTCSG